MTTAYKAGQITLTNGSAVVTGVGTAWLLALIAGGLVAPEAAGNMLPIETVDSDTQITAATKWVGASGTYDYAIIRDTAYLEQLSVNSNTLARLIAELDAGTIYKYDAAGDLAGRATYDERSKGFSYLVFIGVSEPALYVKASATSGDWDGPFAYGTGPVGPMGPAGYANPRSTYGAATAYARNDAVLYNGSSFVALQATTGNAPPTLPTTANAYWQLTAVKGTDGTGTGDVVGPTGGVATNDIVAFDTTTGKLIKKAPNGSIGNALLANMANATFKGRLSAGAGAPEDLTPAQARGVMGVDILGGYRNKLINGDFSVWQRATTQTTAGFGSDDRWNNQNNGTTKTHSLQTFTPGQTDVPGGPSSFSRTAVTSVAGASNYAFKYQSIENAHLLAGKLITVTLYAKADAAKNIGFDAFQSFGSGGSPSAIVQGIGSRLLALTALWQKLSFTVTMPSVSGKTFGTANDHCTGFRFWFDAGTSFATPSAGVGQQNGTFDIARVSVVEGDATNEVDPFSPRHIQQEFALCQRYYEKGQANFNVYGAIGNPTGHNLPFNVQKRVVPTVTQASFSYAGCGSGAIAPNTQSMFVTATTTATGQVAWSVTWAVEAEL